MIPIQNIYYMLSYAFKVLTEQGYKNIATEQFDNMAELCSAILVKGVSFQIKRGLGRDYLQKEEGLPTVKGRIEVSETIKTLSILKQQLICSYDDFSVNSYMNRIIKTTMELLLRSDISKNRKKELKKILAYFSDVETLDFLSINWNIQYNRNNQTYRMLISICYLVIKGLLQTNADGSTKLMDFLDEQRMSHLYEKFILEYYRREFPLLDVSSSQISWALDDGIGTMLPVMQSDIMLTKGNDVLIIDAKYYTNVTQTRFNVHKQHSHNLYQIFTYVKNKEKAYSQKQHKVSGMILYAATENERIDEKYQMSGNQISVKTLDLNCDFSKIREQLDLIVNDHFKLTI